MRNNYFLPIFILVAIVFAQFEEVILPPLSVTVEQESMDIRKLAASRKIVINQKDFESLGDITAGDIIKRYPGLWVQGPGGSNRNVMLCGLDKVFQAILIDGNRPCGGESDREFKLDRIPLEIIEKIEIINIPTVDYCSDAVAGVVNIITKKNSQKNFLTLDIAPSTNSTNYDPVNGETYLSIQKKNLFISGSYNRETRINLEELEDSATGINGEVEEDCEINIITFNSNYNLFLDEDTRITLKGLFSDFDEIRDVVQDVKFRSQGGLNYRDIITDQTILRRIGQFGISFNHRFDDYHDLTSEISASRADDEKEKYVTEDKVDSFVYTDENEDQLNHEYMFSADYKNLNSILFSYSNTVKTGLKLNYLTRDYNRFVKTTEIADPDTVFIDEDGSFDYSELQGGLYLRDEVYIEPVIFSFGLRAEYAYYDYKVIASGRTGNSDYLFFNPSILINYKLNENYIIKSGFSRQIARPPFASVVPIDKIKTKKSVIERGNPDLNPADALTYNLGFEFYKDKDFYSVYGYFKDVKDIIEIENVGIDSSTGYTINQFVNISTALVFGVDFEFMTDLNRIGMKGFSIAGNYSWLGSQVKDENIDVMRRINEQPMNIANLSLSYRTDPWVITIGATYSDEKIIWGTIVDGIVIDKMITDQYLQFDGSAKYLMRRNTILYFNVSNIFGEDVRVTQGNVTGIEEVGTKFTLGMKYNIKGI